MEGVGSVILPTPQPLRERMNDYEKDKRDNYL